MQMQFMDQKENGKKNVMTFLFGSICWFLLGSYLFTPGRIDKSSNFILYGMKNFFMWLVIIDICCVAIIYKLYYNRSIFNEVVEVTTPIEKNNKEYENTDTQPIITQVTNETIKFKNVRNITQGLSSLNHLHSAINLIKPEESEMQKNKPQEDMQKVEDILSSVPLTIK